MIRRVETSKAAKRKIEKIYDDTKNHYIIHYSCESFYDIKDGKAPRITSIAIKDLYSGQTHSFSIHKIAEGEKIEAAQITSQYDACEKKMLEEYFDFVERHANCTYIHWGMTNINYGFDAIYHRAKVLGINERSVINDECKIDLSQLLKNRYGSRYANHPRLTELFNKNNITPKDFLSGKDEAEAFDDREFVRLSSAKKILRYFSYFLWIIGKYFVYLLHNQKFI